jgi:simple sugar transport system substrate-binding protein
MRLTLVTRALLVVLVTAGLAAADDPGAGPETPATAPRLRLLFISPAVEAQFFEPVKQGMRDAARMMDVDCAFTGTEGVDLPSQVAMVRRAVADGYDGIVLNIVDPRAFDEVVEEAVGRGVPVVAFNVDDHDTPNARLSAVCQRLYQAGRSLAERAAPEIPEGSHVLMTMHDRGVSALEDRLRGLQDVLQGRKIRWTLAITGNDAAEGANVIAGLLRKHPEIRVVLGTGQSDTEAAGRAIEKGFDSGEYWSAGFDLSPQTLRLIEAGHIRWTVDQQPYAQGFYPVVQLALFLRYGIVPSDIDTGAAIIDRDNARQVLELSRRHFR